MTAGVCHPATKLSCLAGATFTSPSFSPPKPHKIKYLSRGTAFALLVSRPYDEATGENEEEG
jgi:hypothetical protein